MSKKTCFNKQLEKAETAVAIGTQKTLCLKEFSSRPI